MRGLAGKRIAVMTGSTVTAPVPNKSDVIAAVESAQIDLEQKPRQWRQLASLEAGDGSRIK